MSDHKPVAQSVNSIVAALDEIASLALKEETRAEVAAQKVTLGRILSRTELILSFLDARRPRNSPRMWIVK